MSSFYKKFFWLMLPMALKELISSLVNLVDTIMVGKLGETAIASVGIGNQIYFLYTVFLFGICCGANVFSSQFWGKRDIPNMRSVLGLSLGLAILLGGLFTSVALIFPTEIYRAYNATDLVLEQGITYLRIVSIGYIATAITTAFDFSVCSSENAGLPFLVRVLGLIINVIFNQILIFGFGSIPALGVKGAAIATVVARFSELFIMLTVVYSKKMVQAAKFKELTSISRELFGKFWKVASPVMLNEAGWALGMALYSWVFARISPEGMVVITIVQNIERLMFVFFHGGGNAAGVLIGKAVGAEDYDNAYNYAKKLAILSIITALGISALFIPARPLLMLPYNVSESVYHQAMNMLLILAVMMNVKSVTFLLIVGVFRNGGDTRSAFLIDLVTVWLIGVPIVLLGGFVFKLPLVVCYALMSFEEIGKIIASIWHFRSKKWIKNIVSQI